MTGSKIVLFTHFWGWNKPGWKLRVKKGNLNDQVYFGSCQPVPNPSGLWFGLTQPGDSGLIVYLSPVVVGGTGNFKFPQHLGAPSLLIFHLFYQIFPFIFIHKMVPLTDYEFRLFLKIWIFRAWSPTSSLRRLFSSRRCFTSPPVASRRESLLRRALPASMKSFSQL